MPAAMAPPPAAEEAPACADDVAVAVAPAATKASPDTVAISWRKVCYAVPTANKDAAGAKVTKAILEDVSGHVEPGEFLAIMGPSGSGKTSLLNVLAGRAPLAKGASLVGTITLGKSGSERRHADIARFSAYVEQHDALFELSTTRETLLFAARLRLPELTLEQQRGRVAAVIDELGLTACADTLVGAESRVRGLSGGERKRVSIGVDLLRNPPLVFLDEPTSGLDSYQANNVVSTLRDLASNGHTVLCSIHQPRSSIYNMMDRIALLSRGRSAYFGPAGEPVSEYFAALGYAVPGAFNPADHFLDVISVDTRGEKAKEESEKRVEAILGKYTEDQTDLLTASPPELHHEV